VASRGSPLVQSRDLVIVLAGAILVLAATAYAAYAPTEEDYVQAYFVLPVPLPIPNFPTPLSSAGYSSTNGMDLGFSNVTSYHFSYNVTSTLPFPMGASAHLRVTAPNGTVVEKDASLPNGGTALSLVLDVSVEPVPPTRVVQARSFAEANATLAPAGHNGTGSWHYDFSFSPGSPVGPPATIEASTTVWMWIGVAVPAQPLLGK
jgi:hypothetical protein